MMGFARAQPILRTWRGIIRLSLPVADATARRPARPYLNPRVERLGVERITVSVREPGPRRAMRSLRAQMRDARLSGFLRSDACSGSVRFHASLRMAAVAIDAGTGRSERE